jgi:hypothetical protein
MFILVLANLFVGRDLVISREERNKRWREESLREVKMLASCCNEGLKKFNS